MTPKEKAIELVNKFYTGNKNLVISRLDAKQCALICVDDEIESCKHMDKRWHDSEEAPLTSVFDYQIEYLEEVKQEIENL